MAQSEYVSDRDKLSGYRMRKKLELQTEYDAIKAEWPGRSHEDKAERKRQCKSEYLAGKMWSGKMMMLSKKYRIPRTSLAQYALKWIDERDGGVEIQKIVSSAAVDKASDRLSVRMEKAMEGEFDEHVAMLKKRIKDRYDKLEKMVDRMDKQKLLDPQNFETIVRTEDRLDQMNRRAFEKDIAKVDVTSNGQQIGNQMAVFIEQCREKVGTLGNLDRLLDADVVIDSLPDTKTASCVGKTDDPSALPLKSQESEVTS